MSSSRRFLCGAPESQCIGSYTKLTKGWHGSSKSHGSRAEAFACYVDYLVKQGYVRLGPHEFASPNDGPILLLNRVSQFGGVLRMGKEDRFMPERGSGAVY